MPAAVLEQVAARADGIPLFIEELTRAVLGFGLLDGAGGRAASHAPLPALAIPSTLQDSLMARLDQLGPAKFVAQLASAIGREFSYPLLDAIAPLPPERLRADLAALEEAGLVHARGEPVGEVFAFKHALVQEVAYQTLLRSRRQELHAQIAQVLEERFPQHTRDAPELLAHHWTEAGNAERAVAGWLAAGERACERSEYSEAIGHLRKGAGAGRPAPDPEQRRDRELAILLALGPVLMMVTGAGTPEVARLYARALELCDEMPKSGLHFAARWGRWRAAMDHRAGLERADDLLSSRWSWTIRRTWCRRITASGRRSTCSARTRSAAGTRTRASASTTRNGTACMRISTAGTTPRSARSASGRCRAGCSGGSTRASPASGSPASGPIPWRMWGAASTPWTTRSRCTGCAATRARWRGARPRWWPSPTSSG